METLNTAAYPQPHTRPHPTAAPPSPKKFYFLLDFWGYGGIMKS